MTWWTQYCPLSKEVVYSDAQWHPEIQPWVHVLTSPGAFIYCPWPHSQWISQLGVNTFNQTLLTFSTVIFFFSRHNVEHCIWLTVLVPGFIEMSVVSLCRIDFINISELVKTWLRAFLDELFLANGREFPVWFCGESVVPESLWHTL